MNADLLKVDFSKYESPITKIVGKAIEEMQTKMIQQEEDRLIMECRETVGFHVNKDELIRALNYDRDQYAKGYAAGLNADRWISVKDQLPEEYGEYLITWITSQSKRPFIAICECEISNTYNHEKNRFDVVWLLDDYIKAYPDVEVIAWQPLPEPAKVGDEE